MVGCDTQPTQTPRPWRRRVPARAGTDPVRYGYGYGRVRRRRGRRDRIPDRVRPDHRRRGPHRAGRRHRRGTRAGRPGRRAGAVAADGVPDKPGAWLMATAKHRAIDLVRRKETYARKLAEVGRDPGGRAAARPEPADPDDIDDDLLRLIFTACHPVLSDRGPHRPHAAAARRPDHGRDRPRLPGPRGDRRPAHRPRQTHPAPRQASPSRCRTAPSARPASARSWKSST